MSRGATLGALIRERRRANGLSQQELATRMGTFQPVVSKWENDGGEPDRAQVERLEEILGGITREEERAESPSPISTWLSRAMGKRNMTATELAGKANVSVPTIYNLLSGRAENPHTKTIKALESVLGDEFESREEVRESAGTGGVGELIDFSPYPEDGEIPEKPGVYVLYDISERPIYVGKAINIASRLKGHHDKFWFKRPIVETGAYIEIRDERLRDQVETVLIRFLKKNAVINKNKTARGD